MFVYDIMFGHNSQVKLNLHPSTKSEERELMLNVVDGCCAHRAAVTCEP